MRLSLLLMALATGGFAQNAVLKVQVTGIRNAKGQIGVAIYERENSKAYPKDPSRARAEKNAVIVDGTAEVEFSGLVEGGTYAVAARHDENANGKLDMNFVGIPKEGFGFSNNAKPRAMGPATFEDAAFTFRAGGAIVIRLRY